MSLSEQQLAARTHALVNGTIFPERLNVWYCPVCRWPVWGTYVFDPNQECSGVDGRHQSLAIGRTFTLERPDEPDATVMVDGPNPRGNDPTPIATYNRA